ncbi:MAG: hypothetical protein M0042_09065 [Nitrospiraceae bacterium]|nr:hypothetical protein [Nitrospiraceae bacterium]
MPVLLPVFESFDQGLGWLAQGNWSAQPGGWFADSALRDQTSTLTVNCSSTTPRPSCCSRARATTTCAT